MGYLDSVFRLAGLAAEPVSASEREVIERRIGAALPEAFAELVLSDAWPTLLRLGSDDHPHARALKDALDLPHALAADAERVAEVLQRGRIVGDQPAIRLTAKTHSESLAQARDVPQLQTEALGVRSLSRGRARRLWSR